jgi:hypothetical protein
MQILGIHILTDKQLRKKLQDARDKERGWAGLSLGCCGTGHGESLT